MSSTNQDKQIIGNWPSDDMCCPEACRRPRRRTIRAPDWRLV